MYINEMLVRPGEQIGECYIGTVESGRDVNPVYVHGDVVMYPHCKIMGMVIGDTTLHLVSEDAIMAMWQ